MSCPRCKTEFAYEPMNYIGWFISLQLDALQTQYIKGNYFTPLCYNCVKELKESFYACGINPAFRPKLKNKI